MYRVIENKRNTFFLINLFIEQTEHNRNITETLMINNQLLSGFVLSNCFYIQIYVKLKIINIFSTFSRFLIKDLNQYSFDSRSIRSCSINIVQNDRK